MHSKCMINTVRRHSVLSRPCLQGPAANRTGNRWGESRLAKKSAHDEHRASRLPTSATSWRETPSIAPISRASRWAMRRSSTKCCSCSPTRCRSICSSCAMRAPDKAWQAGSPHHQGLCLRRRRLAARALRRDGRAGRRRVRRGALGRAPGRCGRRRGHGRRGGVPLHRPAAGRRLIGASVLIEKSAHEPNPARWCGLLDHHTSREARRQRSRRA